MKIATTETTILRLLVVIFAIATGALGWYLLRGQQLAEGSPSILTSQQLETLIGQYIKENPEIITSAIQDAQAEAEKAKADQGDAKLAELSTRIFDDPADPVLGNPQADLAMVEFFDYRCPYCKRVAADVDALVGEDTKLRIVFKEFPILGPESVFAAKLALAAGQQGKYREMHTALMDHRGDFGELALMELAKGLGLDVARLKSDLDGPAIAGMVQTNLDLGREMGVSGTPAFIIGRKVVPGAISRDEMKKLIAEARAEPK